MELFSSTWHIASAFLIFITGFLLSLWLSKRFRSNKHRCWILYLWHTLFCFGYLFFLTQNAGDAIGYYNAALRGNIDFKLGTAAVSFITYLFVSIADLSFLGLFLVFNIFGYIGLLAFDASLRIATADKSRRVKMLATLIVFMPSVSFWTSAIGKDSLAFMAVGLALWATIDLRRRQLLLIFSIIVMLLVRPHMAGIMVIALAMSSVLDPKVNLKTRLITGLITFSAALAMVPFALSYAGLGDASNLGDVEEYVNQRQGYNMEGGGSVDIASMSLPMQLFTYLFRPAIFEARNITSLAAALDNTLLLIVAALAITSYLKRRSFNLIGRRVFMWIYVMTAWAVLATTTANLGIAVRQKWMFVPFLIFLLIPFIGKNKARPINPSSGLPHTTGNPYDNVNSSNQ